MCSESEWLTWAGDLWAVYTCIQTMSLMTERKAKIHKSMPAESGETDLIFIHEAQHCQFIHLWPNFFPNFNTSSSHPNTGLDPVELVNTLC